MTQRSYLTALALLCMLMASPLVTSAQQLSTEKLKSLQFSHQAMNAEALQRPGDPLTIVVTVKNSRNMDLRMRLHATRDGVLLDLPLIASFDQKDNLNYSTTLLSPLGELSYQFVIYDKDDSPVRTSKRYVIRRSCVPNISLAELDPAPITPEGALQEDPALTALLRARGLESDIAYLQQAIQVLEESRSLLVEEAR